MKKSIFLAALAVVVAVCTGCDKERQTPTHDTTALWPAMSNETGNYGYINEKGVFVIPATYDEAAGFSCGYAWVLSGKNLFYIDTKGKMQDAPYFNEADYFFHKYACVKLDDLYGMLNTKFKYVIQPTFNDLGRMGDNGLAAAQLTEDGLFGYVNSKGKWVIQPVYEDAEMFQDGIAVIELGDKDGVINANGEFLIPPTYDKLMYVGSNMVAFRLNKKWGVLDKKGEVLIAPVYDDLGTIVDNDLLPAAQNSKSGYLNRKGDTKIAFMYHSVWPFFEDYAWVQQSENGVWMSINTKGTIQFPLQNNEEPITGFHNGLALVARTHSDDNVITYRYINVRGEQIYSWDDSSSLRNAPIRVVENVSPMEMTLHFDSRNL